MTRRRPRRCAAASCYRRSVLLRVRRSGGRLRQLDPLLRRTDRIRRRQHRHRCDGDVLGRDSRSAGSSSIWLASRFTAGWMLVGSMTLALVSSMVAGDRQRRQHRAVDRHVPVRCVDRPAVRVDDRLRRGPLRIVGRCDIGLRRRRRSWRVGDAVDGRPTLRCTRPRGATDR